MLEAAGRQGDVLKLPTLALMSKVWDRGKSNLGVKGCSRCVVCDLWTNSGLHTIDQVQSIGYKALHNYTKTLAYRINHFINIYSLDMCTYPTLNLWIYQFRIAQL